MSQQVYLVAPTEDRARQILAEIKQMGIELSNISVINERSEIQRIAHPQSEEFRNALNGSIVGAIIGLFYGAATLTVIGAASIPGILGASLILGYSALGGVIFGAIIGSTGLFARTRIPKRIEGGTLITVEIPDPKQRQELISAMEARGLSDIQLSGEPAA
jgi:hypothetical protein